MVSAEEAVTFAVSADPQPASAADTLRFAVSYSTTQSGVYAVEVALGGTPAVGSPFSLVVQAGPAVADACLLDGQGRQYAVAGRENPFIVYTFDAYGNPCFAGGLEFDVDIDGPLPISGQVRLPAFGVCLCLVCACVMCCGVCAPCGGCNFGCGL